MMTCLEKLHQHAAVDHALEIAQALGDERIEHLNPIVSALSPYGPASWHLFRRWSIVFATQIVRVHPS